MVDLLPASLVDTLSTLVLVKKNFHVCGVCVSFICVHVNVLL